VRRLYLQFYLTIVGSLVAVVLAAAVLWRFAPNDSPSQQAFEMAGELVAAHLAPAAADVEAQQTALERLHGRLDVDLGLFSSNRRPLAASGAPVPMPPPRRETGGWVYGRGGPAWAIRLPDHRWLVARPPARQRRPVAGILVFLGVIVLVVAACAYPLVRRLTRRLERLQAGVESLGAGDLSARVKVEGKDEVARLAASFNRAAARIEELVQAHKSLLANTSHELRTPLSRIRLGIELMKENPDATRSTELAKDIDELDTLIDEILLSSRLDAAEPSDHVEDVDVLAVAAEEAARYERCSVSGDPVIVRGKRILLQRMIRNLLDNAARHGAPPVQVNVQASGSQVVVTVMDEGSGIAAADQQRAFEPFHRVQGKTVGTGLGLAIVRQIARHHGGDAWWAGTPAHPSAIKVSIPSSRVGVIPSHGLGRA
jgi:signal transduction histidine kinase